MKEPKIGWINYFINQFTGNTIINEIILHFNEIDYDTSKLKFNTSWMDYNNKKLK